MKRAVLKFATEDFSSSRSSCGRALRAFVAASISSGHCRMAKQTGSRLRAMIQLDRVFKFYRADRYTKIVLDHVSADF